jgi:PAS domain S-box-containing protein
MNHALLWTDLDLFHLIRGFAFLVMAGCGARLSRKKTDQVPWVSFGLFGVFAGLHAWSEALVFSLGDSLAYDSARVLVLAFSFCFLLRIGYTGMRGPAGRALRPWIVVVLLAGAAAGGLDGVDGLETGVRYALGLAGGTWAAWALWAAARGAGGKRDGSLAVTAIALGGYVVFSCTVAPRAPFFPAASSDPSPVGAGFELLAALCCVLSALIMAVSLSRYAERRSAAEGAPTPWRKSPIVLLGPPLALLMATGWLAVGWLGYREDARQRALLLDVTQDFAATIPSSELGLLTATEEDLRTPTYRQLKDHLRVLRENMPGARFLYLMRRISGTVRFLADSEPAEGRAESPPGQVYGESTPGLDRVFTTGAPLVEGPVADRWGVWVSALVPLGASDDGSAVAVLGVDQNASLFQRAVSAERLRGILALLLLLATTLAAWALRGRFKAELRACGSEHKPDLVLRWGSPAIVLVAGAGLFLLASLDARRQAQRSFDSSFRRHALDQAEALSRGLSRQLIELNGLAAFLEGPPPLDRATFTRFAREMRSESRAIEALAWVPRVSWQDRPLFEARARREGRAAFGIGQRSGEGSLQPAGRRDEYFPVLYLSQTSSRFDRGLDLASNAIWKRALDRARDSGLPGATEPLRSVSRAAGSIEVVAFVPVYAVGPTPRTSVERSERLQGFAVGLYRVETLVHEAMRACPAPLLAYVLDDLDAPSDRRELYREEPPAKARLDGDTTERPAVYQRILGVWGRSWRLQVEQGAGFRAANFNRWYRLIFPFGVILSALAAFLASQTLNGRIRAERRTRQNQRLTEEQLCLGERFSLAAESAGIGVWDLDPRRGTLVCDERMHRLYGVPSTDQDYALEVWEELIHPDDRARVRTEMRDAICGIREPNIEFRTLGPAGEVRHLKSVAHVVRDDTGLAARLTGVSYDITERKQAELLRHRALERQDRLNQLQQTLLAPGDLAQKLKIITDGVVDIFGADFCRVWHIARGDSCDRGCIHAGVTEGPDVCRNREKCLHLAASSGRYTHLDGAVHRRIPLGAYKIGLVASGAEHKFLTNDVVHDARVHNPQWARDLGLVSFAGYQLRPTGGETLGVLALFSRRALTPEEDAHLDALSNTAAQVIHAGQVDLLMRRERILLRTVIDHIPYAIYAKDTQGQKTLTNVADELMTGLVSPSPGEKEAGPNKAGCADSALDRDEDQSVILNGRAILHREEDVVGPDGRTIWLDTSKVPLRDEAGAIVGMVGIGQEITDRKKAESEHVQMELQLRHAQKMESIGQLAAGIAHEINTPTQFIGDNNRFLHEAFASLKVVLDRLRAVLEAARRGRVPNSLVAEGIAALEAADLDYLMTEIPSALAQSLEGVGRVAKIVGAMKEFSHPGGDEFTAADINHAIESTVSVCRNEWKYVADLVTDFDPTLPAFPCMVGDFNQVILNLIINAAHAIGEAASEANPGKGTITVSTRRDGLWAEVRVSDTGAGIPESIRGHIFTPFFTTKAVGKGTGQGLAIARSVVVDKHGGEISFETEVGRGTTFIVRLPMERAAAADGPGAVRQAA